MSQNEELKPEELENVQGAGNAQTEPRRRSQDWDGKTDPGGGIPTEQLKGITGGAGTVSGQKTENRGTYGEDPENVIQDPHGGFDRQSLPGGPKG